MTSTPLITRQGGFSIVELMVAITIGLLLIAGLGQVFVGSKRAYRTHEGVEVVQENGRFAIEIVSRQIRLAGYRPNPLQPPNITVAAMPANSETVSGVESTTAGGRLAGTDELLLAYVGSNDNLTTDCMGNGVNSGEQVVNNLFISDTRELRCTVSDNAGNQQTQSILEGISDMQVLYGVDNSNCGTSVTPITGFRYVDANNVTQWCDVKSIRLVLTADSIDSVDPSLPNGGRLERDYSATVRVRNAF